MYVITGKYHVRVAGDCYLISEVSFFSIYKFGITHWLSTEYILFSIGSYDWIYEKYSI